MAKLYKFLFLLYYLLRVRKYKVSVSNSVSPKDLFATKKNSEMSIALVFPGASVSKNISHINGCDKKLGVNLAASLAVGFDEIMFEKLDYSKFGNAQFELVNYYASKKRGTKLLVKNLWMGENMLPLERFRSISEVMVLRDLPLRGWFGGKKSLLNYLSDFNFGFSAWKSSVFTAVQYAVANGYRSIYLYGLDGGGKYFWEVEGSEVVVSSVKNVVSQPIHGSENGAIKTSEIVDEFLIRIAKNNDVTIEIIK